MGLYDRFLCDEDCDLEDKMNDIQNDMQQALKAIETCEQNPDGTVWRTSDLKKDIQRFIEDWF